MFLPLAGRLCGALTVVAASICASCGERPESEPIIRPVRAVRIGDVASFSGRQFPGRAEAYQQAELSFRVSGTLTVLSARLGTEVQEGEIVAQLDARDFEVRVRGAEAALARAQADVARTREEFTRGTSAFERGGVSEIEMVRVREALNIATATAEAMEAELQSTRDDLTDTSLRSPFNGEIAARFVENFQDVRAKQPVVRIIDNDRIKFTVYIPENMMALLTYVEEIRCEFDAFPGNEIVATIDEVGREADSVTRTFPITLVMEQPEGVRILSGMTGRAWVARTREPGEELKVFDLPMAAIVDGENGAQFVWVINESSGVVTKQLVTTGPISQAGIRVSGLERGSIVATAGAAFLREGQQVRAMTSAAASEGLR